MKRSFVALGVGLALSLSACASAASSEQTTQTPVAPATTAPAVPKMYGTVVRIAKPNDGSGWVHVGVQRDGESTWLSFYCNDGICYNLEVGDHIAYTVDFPREVLNDVEVTGSR